VPPVADQVTAVLLEPVTVAVNCWMPLVEMDGDVGLIDSDTGGGWVVTVRLADADFVRSATLVAVTVKVPAVLGEVYKPDAVIVPPVADQVTAVLLEPVTVAVNCCVFPVWIEDEDGLIETETDGGGAVTVTVAVADFVESATLVAVMVYVPGVIGAV
jgi:hypothetical protein